MLGLIGLFTNPATRALSMMVAGLIALTLWTGAVAGYSYLKGANNQANKEELKRKDNIIKAQAADLKRNQDFSSKAKADQEELEKIKSGDAQTLAQYKLLLESEDTKNGNDKTLIPRNQCPKVCGADRNFIDALRSGRVR